MNKLQVFVLGFWTGVLTIFAVAKASEYITGSFDALYHKEWRCTDARIDGLTLPLEPVCWEYQRKDVEK